MKTKTLSEIRAEEHTANVRRARARLERLAKSHFITVQERQARVAAAAKLLNLETRTQIAEACGMHRPSFERTLKAKSPSLWGLQRIALGLSVSISYLVEK